MKERLLLLFVLISGFVQAQEPLSKSLRTSSYRYIYQLTAEDALVLYRTNLAKAEERYLHTRVDSFLMDESIPSLEDGNYLIVHAAGNRLHYELKTVGDLTFKLVNNRRDLAVYLHRAAGQAIGDARVRIKGRELKYDARTRTYRLKRRRQPAALHVLHDGVTYYFPLQGRPKGYSRIHHILEKLGQSFPIKYVTKAIDRWINDYSYYSYFDRPVPHERKFRGFLTFNKPIYKPGDTVKLKAFVMNRNGKGVREKLLVRLTDEYFTVDTIIGTVRPYRQGGYTFGFVLNDSLDLDLDDKYLITLEEERSRKYDLNEYDGDLDEDEYAAKRKVVMRGKFEYEDYELQSINFTARADRMEHSRGQMLALFLKATDENDLPIMDGRLEIHVLAKPGSTTRFHQPSLFLPDTLWKHEQALESMGETKVTLPDSIFPRASFNYEVQCILLNSNNERHTQNLYLTFHDQERNLSFDLRKDSLQIDHLVRGKSVPSGAVVYALNRGDTLQTLSLRLPGAVRLNPYALQYKVRAEGMEETFELKSGKGLVTALASRTRDSLFILLNNPHRLPVWYTVFAGNKAIYRGHADTLTLNARTKTPRNYFLSLQYLYGNTVYNEDYTIAYQDKLLQVSVGAPMAVHPGQTATIEIGVKDAEGKAVADADVTAYAFTRKFSGASAPYVPYLGRIYRGRKMGSWFQPAEDQEWARLKLLNWQRWSREMGLDSVEYYRFLRPRLLYLNWEAAKDSITQIAPFVVINGELQPVHLLYIDEVPHFFSQSGDVQRYSFRVAPGKHHLRFRTADRLIIVNDVEVPKGIKTILSVRGDTATERVSFQRMPDTLTGQEKALMAKYFILINHQYGAFVSYVQQEDRLFLLRRSEHAIPMPSLIGPIMPHWARLVVHERFAQDFEVEPGYLYTISPGLIKQKDLGVYRRPFKWLSKTAPSYDFSDLVLTQKEIDSLWQDYLDTRSANEDLFYHPELSKKGKGELRIEVGKDREAKEVFIRNLFLFRYDHTDFLRIYKGSSRNLGYVAPGRYRLFLLLKDDRYILKDSILIKPNGANYYRISADTIKGRDSVSRKLSEIVGRRELAIRQDGADLDTIRSSFHSLYLDTAAFQNHIYGQVRDNNGLPLPAVTVQIKGTKVATSTDANGFYRIRAPQQGTLVFLYVGFEAMEQSISGGQHDAVLRPATNHLQEVVVTGYSTSRKRELTGSVAAVNQLAGRVPGVYIRGNSTSTAGAPLIVVDGVPYTGSLDDLDLSLIGNISVLKQEAAVALYGSRASGGAIVVTTRKAPALATAGEDGQPASSYSLRRRFRDHAYWMPALRTDREGKVRFTTTFPDDITSWRTFVIAMSDRKRTGYAEGLVKSYKPVSAILALPQFAIEGDSLNVTGKTLNYGADSILLKRTLSFNDQLLRDGSIDVRNAYLDTLAVVIGSGDSARFRLEVQKDDGYFDGEERTIPVYKQGVLETQGIFLALEGDTSLTLQLDPSLGKITLHAEASLMPVLLDEAEKVRRYEYGCNEQLASKLKALIVQKRISKSLGKEFDGEKSMLEIISKLNSSKTGNLWGWWASNEPAPWISLHVIEALLQAEKEGYNVNLYQPALIDVLVYHMEHYRERDQLLTLHLLHGLDAKVDFKKYIDTLEKSADKASLYDKLRLTELKQKTGLEYSMDSILPRAKRTLFGNLYWGEEGYRFFDNSIQNTVLMYRILRAKGGHEATLRRIRAYFLEKRKDGQWRNTYESSLILETILPDLMTKEGPPRAATLSLTGSNGETVKDFPFHREIDGGERISLRKEGDLPVYFTAYQQKWNRKPAAVSDAFTVRTVFVKAGDTVTWLKAGEPVSLEVQVTARGDADYVMIEIPIPAGCSYKDKPQPRYNGEVHREYFRNKVSIFCSSLKQGTYAFRIPLLPRYTGNYHLNPAKAEMMYFPVFYGREGMKQVSVQ